MAAAGDDAGASQSLPERRMSIISYFRKGKNLRINHFIPRFSGGASSLSPPAGRSAGEFRGPDPGKSAPP